MKKLLITLGLAAMTVAGANAQTLVTFNFTGAAGNQTSQPTASVATGLTATPITRGSGITPSAAANSISSTGFTTGLIDLDDYYEFSITPSVGYTLDVGTLTFAERRSATGIRDWSIRTSLDSFAVNLVTVNVPDDTLTRDQSYTFGSAFDAISSTLTIRIYGFNAESGAGTWRLANDSSPNANMQLTGVAVPEPGTWLLIGLGSAVILARLRSKKA